MNYRQLWNPVRLLSGSAPALGERHEFVWMRGIFSEKRGGGPGVVFQLFSTMAFYFERKEMFLPSLLLYYGEPP